MHKIIIIFTLSIALNSFGQQLPQGAKLLKSIFKTKFLNDGSITENVLYEFKVETEQGRLELTNYRVPFNGPVSNFKLLSAQSILLGEKSLFDPKNIQFTDYQQSNVGLSDIKIALITSANIRVGSVVTFNYEITTPALLPGSASKFFSITNEVLANEEYYIFESEKPLKYETFNFDDFYSAEFKIENSKQYLTIKPTAKAYALEGKKLAVGEIAVTNLTSWKYINTYYSEMYRKVWQGTLPLELKQVVEKAKKIKAPKQQIEFVSQELSQLVAYSGNWTTDYKKFIPQDFKVVLKSKLGDCKDYATMLTAILRQLNFEAFPALVTSTPQYRGHDYMKLTSSIPMLGGFNHAITWAKDSAGKEWWIDPTAPVVNAEVISQNLLGNFSLVLDGQTDGVKFLPEKNSLANNLTIEQKVKITGIQQEVVGNVIMNDVSYALIAHYEKLGGIDAVKKVLSAGLLLGNNINMNISKNMNAVIPSYNFSYVTQASVEESSKKSKVLNLFNSLPLYMYTLQVGKDNYTGEIGEFIVKTTVENMNTSDTFESDCLSYTPWLNFSRTVQNVGKDLVVTDRVHTKKRFVNKKDSSLDDFSSSLYDLSICAKKVSINLITPELVLSAEENSEKNKMGPAVELMTNSHLKELEKLRNEEPTYFSKVNAKLIKYFKLRLSKDGVNPDLLTNLSSNIIKAGYLSGKSNRIYLSGYVDEAEETLLKALSNSGEKFNAELYKLLVKTNIHKKNFSQAAKYLKILSDRNTYKFDVAVLSHELAIRQNAEALAKQWIVSAKSHIKNEDEQDIYDEVIMDYLLEEKKYNEVIAIHERGIKKYPKNAWLYNNFGLFYSTVIKDYNKSIQYFKKALDIMEFGAAKNNLSNAYLNLALENRERSSPSVPVSMTINGQKVVTQKRQIAMFQRLKIDNIEKYEADLLESNKWYPENTRTLSLLVELYLAFYVVKKEEKYKSKIKLYTTNLIAADPNSNESLLVLAIVKQALPDLNN